MAKIFSIIKILLEINLLKTLYFNFHYLPLDKALVLPILIYKGTKLNKMRGRVVLYNARFGMIRIGKYGVGTLDIKYDRTIWQNAGTVIFNGSANIGSGTKISVNNGGTVNFGSKFCITGASTIICSKQIEFGNECLLSWDILIMDTDFHNIINTEGKTINESKPIRIGEHVWIGCRNTILKGVNICNDVVIAAGSKISKDIVAPYCIVGGENQKILKENVKWSM